MIFEAKIAIFFMDKMRPLIMQCLKMLQNKKNVVVYNNRKLSTIEEFRVVMVFLYDFPQEILQISQATRSSGAVLISFPRYFTSMI